jgi:hypothetical protein
MSRRGVSGCHSERVKVYVRVKPFLTTDEGSRLNEPCVSMPSMKNRGDSLDRLVLRRPSRQGDGVTAATYAFDGVLGQDASQSDVYRDVAKPIVDDVLRGYNGTILAYGQTGAGKTHTLGSIKPESIGIIPRAAQDIFQQTDPTEYDVRLSYLQIYCEQIQDLLRPEAGDNLTVRECRRGQVTVPELSEMAVTCLDDCLRLIQLGDRNRTVAFTALNAQSSRSHAVVMFTVTRKQGGKKTTGKLFLVDLAGSERLKKSKSVAQRAVEARAINLSLTTLGKCVSARAAGLQHVPFRDSKLTRLLQESLGGNSKTSMVVAVREDWEYAEETYQSMEFGSRAMNVRTHAEVNLDEEQAQSSPSRAMDAFLSYSMDSHAFIELKKDQERSQKVIECLENEKLQMIREARELRDAHEEQLLHERMEKDAYKTRALKAEAKSLETEYTAKEKISELRQQLDRALEQLEEMERKHDEDTLKWRRMLEKSRSGADAACAAAKELHACLDMKVKEVEEKSKEGGTVLQRLRDENAQLHEENSKLREDLVSAQEESSLFKKQAKKAVFKLDILTKHYKDVETRARAATVIQRAYREHRAQQLRTKRLSQFKELARTKTALGTLVNKHAEIAAKRSTENEFSGHTLLGESSEVLQEAVEGILTTFLLPSSKLKDLRSGKMKRNTENDLICARPAGNEERLAPHTDE